MSRFYNREVSAKVWCSDVQEVTTTATHELEDDAAIPHDHLPQVIDNACCAFLRAYAPLLAGKPIPDDPSPYICVELCYWELPDDNDMIQFTVTFQSGFTLDKGESLSAELAKCAMLATAEFNRRMARPQEAL